MPVSRAGAWWLVAFVVPMGVGGSSVLSPTLLAVYTNDIVSHLLISVHRFIVLYANDIMITSG